MHMQMHMHMPPCPAQSRCPSHVSAFESLGFKVPCPSLHIYGDKDALKNVGVAPTCPWLHTATMYSLRWLVPDCTRHTQIVALALLPAVVW